MQRSRAFIQRFEKLSFKPQPANKVNCGCPPVDGKPVHPCMTGFVLHPCDVITWIHSLFFFSDSGSKLIGRVGLFCWKGVEVRKLSSSPQTHLSLLCVQGAHFHSRLEFFSSWQAGSAPYYFGFIALVFWFFTRSALLSRENGSPCSGLRGVIVRTGDPTRYTQKTDVH